MAEQEKEEKAVNARISAFRDAQFKQTQLVHALRTQEQALQADIQGYHYCCYCYIVGL